MIEYLNLEDVAVQRGEKSDLLARKLVANGCYLYLWFDNNRKHKAMMLFPGVSKKEMDYEFDQGTYPLTQGSREALIKILNRGENTTEGLEILIESDDGFKGFVTYQVRLTEEDKNVCVVVNPDDVAKLPPLPKTIEGATVTGELPYAKNNFENFVNYEKDVDERFESGKRKPHTVFITNEIKVNQNRGDTWKKFIQLANDSVGKKQVMIPGYGKIYLRRVRLNPEIEILYSHEQFDHDKSKKMPIGVFLIKRTAFDKAWTKIAQQ